MEEQAEVQSAEVREAGEPGTCMLLSSCAFEAEPCWTARCAEFKTIVHISKLLR